MTSERCVKYELFRRADSAFRNGDIEELQAVLDDPADFPNVRGPWGIECSLLQYAVYHSPVRFIRTLLELGADPNYDDQDGFPSLIAAISSVPSKFHPGRSDVVERVDLLISFGADVHQRGTNDYTPLHYAAAVGHFELVELLLARGADPNAKTRMDDYETPAEVAQQAGHLGVAQILKRRVGN